MSGTETKYISRKYFKLAKSQWVSVKSCYEYLFTNQVQTIYYKDSRLKTQDSRLKTQKSILNTQESKINNPQCTGREARLGLTAWPAGHQSEMAYQAEHQWKVA